MTPKKLAPDFVFKEECYAIVGACFEYCRIPAITQPGLSLEYRGRILSQTYFPDFICYDKIIVELKAVTELTGEHRAQVLNYLKAGRFELGLLVNFGHYPNCNMNASQRHGLNRNLTRRFTSESLALFGVFGGYFL